MKIIHILNHVQEIGNGIVNVAVDLACLQAKSGHNVAVISGGGKYENLLQQYGVKHFTLDQTRTPLNIIRAARRYQAIVKEFEPDIVHAHMMTGVVIAYLCRGKNSYALVSTVHNEFQRFAVLMGLAERVIAVSDPVAKSMVQRGIPKDKIRVVFNGTLGSPRTGSLSEYQPMPLKRPAITTVAGMYRSKGIAELINAFGNIAQTFPEAHLYLVGDGPDRQLFEAQAKSTSISDRIHFEGFQPQPQRYLLATDIFVLPSHRESFSLVLGEAREVGCAIIASNIDGIPQTLDNGQAGILVPPEDTYILAKSLTYLLTNQDQLQNWKEKSKQNLHWLSVARVNEETLGVYRELKVDSEPSLVNQV